MIPSVAVSIEVALPRDVAFERFVAELQRVLSRSRDGVSLRLEPGAGGRVLELRPRSGDGLDEVEVGRVTAWRPGEGAVLSWHPADWDESSASELQLDCQAIDGGARLTITQRGWSREILAAGRDEAEGAGELMAWFSDELAGRLLVATSPWQLGTWLTDRRARRPTGPRAREVYRAPAEHQAGFDATLGALELTADDVLLEVGCGGGAFIAQALASGCRAVAADHSEEMADLTRESNAEAVSDGRLDVVACDAGRLPFGDGAFSRAAMTHMFFFLTEPEAALRESRRVLTAEGRLVVYTVSPELRGTPAAPEPIARQMRFYDDDELESLALAAGFATASVRRHSGAQLLVAGA